MWLPTVDFESTASAVSPPRHEVPKAAMIRLLARFRARAPIDYARMLTSGILPRSDPSRDQRLLLKHRFLLVRRGLRDVDADQIRYLCLQRSALIGRIGDQIIRGLEIDAEVAPRRSQG